MSDLQKEWQVAREAILQAGREVLRLYEEYTPIPDAPATITTPADLASQEILSHVLSSTFPQDLLWGEEAELGKPAHASILPAQARIWIMDPIDGSRGFARKNDEFSIMLALVINGVPCLGLVYEPVQARLTWALRNQGTWIEEKDGPPRQCRVSDRKIIGGATLIVSRSEKGPRYAWQQYGLRIVETYSAGIKLAAVARGEAELYWSTYTGFHPWDLCAGHMLILEAGGEVTDRYGSPIVYRRREQNIPGILASNGLLHQQALEVLGRADNPHQGTTKT
ncbi:MAG: 3'(2'),5'-bisphosphate nucleotidase CysQ [Gemmataceae bacterium]